MADHAADDSKSPDVQPETPVTADSGLTADAPVVSDPYDNVFQPNGVYEPKSKSLITPYRPAYYLDSETEVSVEEGTLIPVRVSRDPKNNADTPGWVPFLNLVVVDADGKAVDTDDNSGIKEPEPATPTNALTGTPAEGTTDQKSADPATDPNAPVDGNPIVPNA